MKGFFLSNQFIAFTIPDRSVLVENELHLRCIEARYGDSFCLRAVFFVYLFLGENFIEGLFMVFRTRSIFFG